MTTTIIPPPPPQPQQSTVNPTLMKCIDELEQHMVNLIQYNLDLKERLDKHGSWLYKLENLNIPHQVSKVVDEIVTDAVDWAIKSYEAHEDHKKLYDVIEKTLEHDYSDQLLSNLEEGRQKKRKRRDVPRTPYGLPPPHPPPPPPPAGASGAPGTSRASRSPQLPLLPLATSTSGSTQQQGSKALTGLYGTQELSPTDSLIPNDSIPDEQTIPSSNVSDVENNWATVLASTYVTPAENSLLAKIRDMTNFLNWYCRQVNKTKLTQADLKGQAYEVVKAFYPVVKGDQVRIDVNLPMPLGGPPGYEFNHDYTIIKSPRAVVFPVNNNERKIMRFNEIYKFSDGT
nr:hypothetical protein [Tanacetum cinerariifolium]